MKTKLFYSESAVKDYLLKSVNHKKYCYHCGAELREHEDTICQDGIHRRLSMATQAMIISQMESTPRQHDDTFDH